MKRKHPIPEGYRQLKVGEKYKMGVDLINYKGNFKAEDCCQSNYDGKVERGACLAYYRKLKAGAK